MSSGSREANSLPEASSAPSLPAPGAEIAKLLGSKAQAPAPPTASSGWDPQQGSELPERPAEALGCLSGWDCV